MQVLEGVGVSQLLFGSGMVVLWHCTHPTDSESQGLWYGPYVKMQPNAGGALPPPSLCEDLWVPQRGS